MAVETNYGCGHTALNENCPFCREILFRQKMRNKERMFFKKEQEKACKGDKDSQEFLTAWFKGEI